MRVLYVLTGTRGGASASMMALLRRLPREQFEAYVVVPPVDSGWLRAIGTGTEGCRGLVSPWWDAKTRLPLWTRPVVWAGAALPSGWQVQPVLTLARWISE